MTDAAERFARHALETPFAAMPEHARAAAKIFILDTIGVGIAGARAPHADAIRRAARAWGGPAVAGAAHAFGTSAPFPAHAAAFVNGFQIHCQEFDCVHEGAVVHPMATILAALLAESERSGQVGGAALLAAVIVAVDVAASLGVAAKGPIRFFRPANAGLFGATLGVARLRGFDLAAARDALGHALAQCSGTMQAHVEGKPALPVQIANAARASLVACDLAQENVPGPHDVFEGPFGYFALFETASELAPVLSALGAQWRIAEVSHKPYPTGRAAQGGVALMQELRAKSVAAEDVETLTLIAPPLIRRLVGRRPAPGMAASYARLCFAYVGARALREGDVGLGDFSPEMLSDARTLALAERIVVEEDGSTDPAAFTPQRAVATLKDGRRIEAATDRLYGAPSHPLTREAHLRKFRLCCDHGGISPRAAAALIARVDALETLTDAGALARLAARIEEA